MPHGQRIVYINSIDRFYTHFTVLNQRILLLDIPTPLITYILKTVLV
jgi:hypothetical protein